MQGIKILMIASLFIIPAISLIIGFISKNNPPKEINKFKGYRTARSMASQEAWDYANRRMGELLIKSTLYTFIIGIVTAIVVLVIKMNVVGVAYSIVLSVVLIIQVILMIRSTLCVEEELENEEYKK